MQIGPEGAQLDPKNAVVVNRTMGDGRFEILNQNPGADLYCGAQVNWQNHELLINTGSLKEKSILPLGSLWMKDSCALTKSLLGDDEFGNATCSEEMLDPRLKGMGGMDGVKFFLDGCNGLLQEHGKKFGREYGNEVTLDRLLVMNPEPNDGNFSLLFNSGAYQFSCEGVVSNFDHDITILSGASTQDKDRQPKISDILTDDCTMSRKLFGNTDYPGKCQDVSKADRNWETGVDAAYKIGITALTARDIYRFIKKKPTTIGNIYRTIRHPVVSATKVANWWRGFSAARSGSNFLTWVRGIGPGMRTAVSGSRIVGYGRGALTMIRGLWPAASAVGGGGGSAAAVGGGTAAIGGGVPATLSLGTVGWAAAAFAAGVGVGCLIENVPRWLGSKYSVSDGEAWVLRKVFGEPSSGTIDFFDHLGFGGWNRFKQVWDE